MRSRIGAGVVAGIIAGLIMAMAMMGYMAAMGKSIWTNPNLIAVMWMGREVAGGAFSAATIVGFLTHMATSALMGIVAIPFIYRLPTWRTMLAAFSYGLASYPVVFAAILTWANPLMVERAGLAPMAAGHALFGIVLGLCYLWLRPDNTRGASKARKEEAFMTARSG